MIERVKGSASEQPWQVQEKGVPTERGVARRRISLVSLISTCERRSGVRTGAFTSCRNQRSPLTMNVDRPRARSSEAPILVKHESKSDSLQYSAGT